MEAEMFSISGTFPFIRVRGYYMPIYEYKCEKCDHSFEKLVFVSDDEDVVCPMCGTGQVKRILSSTSFIGISGGNSCSAGAPQGFS